MDPPPPTTEVVVVEEVLPEGLAEARELLADPAVELAEATLDAARRVDFVRHEVDRGSSQADAVSEAIALAGVAEDAATALREAAEDIDVDLDDPRVAAEAMASLGEQVAETVRQDLLSLEPHVEHDLQVDAVIAGWSSRGSRAEIVDRFDALVDEAAALVPSAQQLPDSPEGCPTLRDNRIAWATAVQIKTSELRAQTAAFDGPQFDELVARYALAPRGEDQVAADAEGRACWADSTRLLTVPERVQDAVDALEDALNP